MPKKEKEEEKSKAKKRKPYQKPELTVQELFEATVLACNKFPNIRICRDSGSVRHS